MSSAYVIQLINKPLPFSLKRSHLNINNNKYLYDVIVDGRDVHQSAEQRQKADGDRVKGESIVGRQSWKHFIQNETSQCRKQG